MDAAKDTYRLSPKQATALRKIRSHPTPINEAQRLLQTTLGALYKRGYVMVRRGHFHLTDEGSKALDLQTNSDILRGASTMNNPFAQVIAELASYGTPRQRRGNVVALRKTA